MNMQPIMVKATAVWLVTNTSLTFEQIAKFCGLHLLEVEAIANEEIAKDIVGIDPVAKNQLEREEIEKGQKDPSYELKLKDNPVIREGRMRRGSPYTPVSRRHDKPAAIAWLLRFHPELTDYRICKLIGTTRNTIERIRNRTHWNMSNIQPTDPVVLGLCQQTDLDAAIKMAEARGASASGAGAKRSDQFATSTDGTDSGEESNLHQATISKLKTFRLTSDE